MSECKLLVEKEHQDRNGIWEKHHYCCAHMPRDLEFCLENKCMLKENE